ncbi:MULTISPECIES: tyrosine-protein kinase Wzc [Serratia]|uniref:tyrosine-protein kinase Wzc n=1 Tax=Serratia TaxID=613 RepID=UPI000B60B935|nr:MULTISPECIES: tyrosine-protein kinase Wzc [Serratia]ASM01511.1 tyrosine-protein kinase [Serratia marcescens]MBH2554699.1 tyrosine-protein kinase Wzc [Serratia ureilytica]QDI17961.1 tyrosine-protein kinase Wzc [Serratia marcescens]QDI27704.1 tyrosine-protein kinase Wzc [Serratia marcescens]QDI42167.1 tyrosine-protein kinase Wzc [Serratia marcescens]
MSDKKKSVPSSDVLSELDITRLMATLVDSRWLICAVTALVTMIGIMYALFSTPIYRADALVQVEKNIGSSLLNDISSMLPTNSSASASEIELIQSRMVIGKTVDDLNLDIETNQDYFPVFGKGFSRLVGNKPAEIAVSRLSLPEAWSERDQKIKVTILDENNYEVSYDGKDLFKGVVNNFESHSGVSLLISGINAPAGTTFTIEKHTRLESINDILDRLTVSDKGKETGVLEISLTGQDPVLIRKIVDGISQNYLRQNVERKSEEAAKSLEFLKEQLPIIRANLDSSENKLNSYRQQNDSVDLSLEAKSVLDTMVSVESQLNQLTFSEAEISKLYTKEHPAYKALLEKRKTLENEKEKLNKRVSSMPKTQQEILRLTRDVQSGQEVYMQLLNKQQELNINKASTIGNVRIVDNAITQPKPVKPKKTILVLAAMIAGLVLSSGYVVLMSLLHRGIESAEQLEENGISVYASIPLSEWQVSQATKNLAKMKFSKNQAGNDLLAVGNPADLAMEAIRSLRTSLHFAMMEAKNNVIVISGASPGIGKTFVCANLAATVALSGLRVLFIDGDMRKGYSHKLFTDGKNHTGLSSVLSGKDSIENAITKTKIGGLDFMGRGQVPPNPSELLMHKNFEKLVKTVSENYDIVLIDTPPILAVTDAAIIGKQAGTSLMVARFDVTPLKEVEVSIRRFEQSGVEIKGVILNAVRKKASGYYGYYQYDYKSSNT